MRLDFEMRLHPICECAGPPSTVASLWEEADAVVRLRITGPAPGPDRWSNPVLKSLPDIKHTASALSVLKPHPMAAAATLTFLQPQQFHELEPYAVGQEFVIFLRWLAPMWDAFERMHANLGGAAAFAIKDGRIRSAGIWVTRDWTSTPFSRNYEHYPSRNWRHHKPGSKGHQGGFRQRHSDGSSFR